MDRFLAASGAAEALEKRREDDAADGARQAAGESKAECATGFWLNSVGTGTSSSTENITYPVYIVSFLEMIGVNPFGIEPLFGPVYLPSPYLT